MQLTQIILEIVILLCGLYLALFKSYFTEKEKNLATLEDIKDITKKVEEVKSEIQNNNQLKSKKEI